MCYVEGCKGEIVLGRDIRTNVAASGECSLCGARYKRFGAGDWKFDTERVDCAKDGCDGFAEFELRPGAPDEAECWKCAAPTARQNG